MHSSGNSSFRSMLPKNIRNQLYPTGGGNPAPPPPPSTTISLTTINQATAAGVGVNGKLLVDTIDPFSQTQVTINSSLTVNGDITVNGTVNSTSENNAITFDRYIFQGAGNTVINQPTSCGLIQNILPIGTPYALSGMFIPGDQSSNARVDCADFTGLAANMLVQISGSTSNDYIYQVVSVGFGSIFFRSTINVVIHDFCRTNFVSESAVGCLLHRITVNIIRGDGPNLLSVATGSTVPLIYNKVAHDGSSPSFTGTTTLGLTLPTVSNNNTLLRLLAVDGNGVVGTRQLSSIVDAFTPSGLGVVLPTSSQNANPGTVGYSVRFDAFNSEEITIRLDSLDHTMAEDGFVEFYPNVAHFPLNQYSADVNMTVSGFWERGLLLWFPGGGQMSLCRAGGLPFLSGEIVRLGNSAGSIAGLKPLVQLKYSRFA